MKTVLNELTINRSIFSFRVSVFVFACCVSGFQLSAQTETLDDWINAYKSQKQNEAQKLCAEGYWNFDGNDNGKEMFNFYVQANYDLTVIDDEVAEDRAYLWVSEDSAGTSKGQMFFYLLKEKKNWIIDGINRHKGYPDFFSAGKIGGHFDAGKLEGTAETDKLGTNILAARLNQKKQQEILYESLAGFSSPEIFDRIDKTEGLSFYKSYYSEGLRRLILA